MQRVLDNDRVQQLLTLRSEPNDMLNKYLDRPNAMYGQAVNRFVCSVPPEYRHGRILDIGCGIPYYLHFAATEYGMDPLGIDGNDKAVSAGKLLGVPVVKGDVFVPGVLDTVDGQFDIISMHRVNFRREMFDEIADRINAAVQRLLKPGGIVNVSLNAGEPRWALLASSWQSASRQASLVSKWHESGTPVYSIRVD